MTATGLWASAGRRRRPAGTGWFATFCAGLVRALPWGLADRVPPNLVGYLLINGFTFVVDLVLLSVFYGRLGWPLAWPSRPSTSSRSP